MTHKKKVGYQADKAKFKIKAKYSIVDLVQHLEVVKSLLGFMGPDYKKICVVNKEVSEAFMVNTWITNALRPKILALQKEFSRKSFTNNLGNNPLLEIQP